MADSVPPELTNTGSGVLPWWRRPMQTMETSTRPGPVASLLFAGDAAVCRSFGRAAIERQADQIIHPHLMRHIQQADLAMVNLESVLSPHHETPGQAGLIGPPEAARLLKEMGFGLAGLANNHIRDGMNEGVMSTLDACDKAGLATVGAAADLQQASRPWRGCVHGVNLCIDALAEREQNIATAHRAGAAPLEALTLESRIRANRRPDELLIMFLHLGHEFITIPSPRTRQFCRLAIEAGAHAVIAHHPHVVQGIEIHRDCPIVYSLGNFCFDSDYVAAHSHWDTGMMVRLDADAAGVRSLEVIPLQIDRQGRIDPLAKDPWQAFTSHLRDLSCVLASDDAAAAAAWLKQARQRFDASYFRLLADLPSRVQTSTPKGPLWLRNWFTCPTHQELFQAVLTQMAMERGHEEDE